MTDIEKELVRNMDSADRCLLWLQKVANLYELMDLLDNKDYLLMQKALANYKNHKGGNLRHD